MWFLSKHPNLLLVGLPLALFFGMLLMLEVGRRIGLRRIAKDPESGKEGMGALEGAVYGLLALLVAFTFGGAASRFDRRRELVVQEVNAIGDACSRIDTLPPELQPALRDNMRRYLDSRLRTYELLPDLDAAMQELRRSNAIQEEIWRDAVAACADPRGQRVTMLVLPAFDQAFDMTLQRTATAMQHPPVAMYLLLLVLSLASGLLTGLGMAGGKRRSVLPMVAYALVTAVSLYTILDLEFPRIGLIRVDETDRLLYELRESMQ